VLAHGAPGTGKSSHFELLAAMQRMRLLKIDATSFPLLGVQEFGLLLEALRPDMLLIDDVDRAPADAVRSRMLFMFEQLRHSIRLIAITANDPTKFDSALLRSERIDDAIEFSLPDREEREEIIRTSKHVRVADVPRLVDATGEFNCADIAGLVRRLRYQTVEDALACVGRLRALAAKAEGQMTSKGDPPSSPPNKENP
jgi:SpoVK/Ycf46/Vps4 family AAA+-type ATPase